MATCLTRAKKNFGNEFASQTFHTFAQMRKKPAKMLRL